MNRKGNGGKVAFGGRRLLKVIIGMDYAIYLKKEEILTDTNIGEFD